MSRQRGVVVTGASSGIGLEIARQFLSVGHKVVLVGRSLERLETAIQSFEDHGDEGATAWALPLAKDVSTVDGCRECIRESVELLGGQLDVLVNNAGAGDITTPLADTTPEKWQWTLNVNLNSVMYLTTAALPHLQSSKGCIVNISSIFGRRPHPGASTYCVSKAALDMYTQCSALELAPKGIRVNGLCPATVATNFHTSNGLSKDQAEQFYEAGKAAHPLGRIGTPADVAAMCLFLADADKAGWVTGQNIVLDGGRLLPVQSAKV